MLTEFIKQSDPGVRALRALYARDIDALREQWLDEAAGYALRGNPRRAHYLTTLAGGA